MNNAYNVEEIDRLNELFQIQSIIDEPDDNSALDNSNLTENSNMNLINETSNSNKRKIHEDNNDDDDDSMKSSKFIKSESDTSMNSNYILTIDGVSVEISDKDNNDD